MILTKKTTRTAIGAGKYRHRTIVKYDGASSTDKTTPTARLCLKNLAATMSDQPEIWLCGGAVPDSISLAFVDQTWVATAEAIVTEGD